MAVRAGAALACIVPHSEGVHSSGFLVEIVRNQTVQARFPRKAVIIESMAQNSAV
jgi:hypothetical protein